MVRKRTIAVIDVTDHSPGTTEHWNQWRTANPDKGIEDYRAAFADIGNVQVSAPTEAPPASNGHAPRAKTPRSTFYLVIGTTKDGSAMDVLGRYDTGHQARKALTAMGMAVARSYGVVNVFQCRDKTSEQPVFGG